MVLNTCEMWSNGIKIAFFPKKNAKKLPSSWGFGPKPPSVIPLSKLVCLHTSPNLHIFIFNFWFERPPFWKLFVKRQTRSRLLIIHSTISSSHKKFLFQKLLMTSLHVIFGLALAPIKNPGYTYARGVMALWAVPPPQITACASPARVNFCTSTRGPANFYPKTGHHKRFFFHETAR